jgi:hypothetical protein
MIRRKQESPTEDEPSAAEVKRDSRCPLPPNIENDLRAIGTQQGLDHCELLEKIAGEYVEHKKLESDCRSGNIADDRCKYIKPK